MCDPSLCYTGAINARIIRGTTQTQGSRGQSPLVGVRGKADAFWGLKSWWKPLRACISLLNLMTEKLILTRLMHENISFSPFFEMFIWVVALPCPNPYRLMKAHIIMNEEIMMTYFHPLSPFSFPFFPFPLISPFSRRGALAHQAPPCGSAPVYTPTSLGPPVWNQVWVLDYTCQVRVKFDSTDCRSMYKDTKIHHF